MYIPSDMNQPTLYMASRVYTYNYRKATNLNMPNMPVKELFVGKVCHAHMFLISL